MTADAFAERLLQLVGKAEDAGLGLPEMKVPCQARFC
jgi:hypothetical protein